MKNLLAIPVGMIAAVMAYYYVKLPELTRKTVQGLQEFREFLWAFFQPDFIYDPDDGTEVPKLPASLNIDDVEQLDFKFSRPD